MYTKRIISNKQEILENLTVNFQGDFGNSGEIKPLMLKPSKNDPDQPNEIIHCHCRCSDLGPIYKLQLKQSIGANKKLKTRWFLDKVKISHLKESYTFGYQKWITNYDDKDRKPKKFEIKLYEQAYKTSRREFKKENNFSRTMSTLSHRLLNNDTVNEDSYDESFNSERSRSNSIHRRTKSHSPSRSESRSPRRPKSRSPSNHQSVFLKDQKPIVKRESRNLSLERSDEFDTDLEKSFNSFNSFDEKKARSKSPGYGSEKTVKSIKKNYY